MHIVPRLIIFAALQGFLCCAACADIVYDIDVRPDFDSPRWSLDGGTITTDGTLGELAQSNILDWNIIYRSNERNFVLTPSNSVAILQFDNAGGLVASATELTMTPASSLEILRFLEPTPSLLYGVDFQAARGTQEPVIFLLDAETNPRFSALRFPPMTSFRIGSAAVPEPGVGLVTLAAMGFLATRRRRIASRNSFSR